MTKEMFLISDTRRRYAETKFLITTDDFEKDLKSIGQTIFQNYFSEEYYDLVSVYIESGRLCLEVKDKSKRELFTETEIVEYNYDSYPVLQIETNPPKNEKSIFKTVSELIYNDEKCPLPLEVIPNYMGINLCSVEAVSWEKQSDGQLKDLTIHFSPAGIKDIDKKHG